MNKTQIGWVVIEKDTIFHDAGFECAAWWQDILVKAGKYPAYVIDMSFRRDNQVDGYIASVWAELEGTITQDYFGSLYCGVPISTYDNKKNAGKKASYRWHSYLYEMADNMLDPDSRFGMEKEIKYELLPEYEAKCYEFRSEYDQKSIESSGIFRKQTVSDPV